MNPQRFGIAPHQKPPKMSEGKWDPYWEGGCFLPTPLSLPPASGIEFEKNAEEVLIQTDEIVKLAQPGDYFEIMKNVGGGGGHHLWIQNFKLKVYYTKHF